MNKTNRRRKACPPHSFASVLLAGIFVISVLASLRLMQTKEFILWIGALAPAAASYLLLEINESRLRDLGIEKHEVDTKTWWTRPVCWSVVFGYGFCVVASNI
ncbi:hypothetical protein [Azotobacter beijerinckii]|uniref:hypothetical protein n=1 Tax=Azotobacter beijerinckii TaxID=170623 RepID=UPI001113E2C5|nr:hypothetical protein [Azotobacter beijerinckii]